MTGAELVTAVLSEGGFDVPRADALAWLNTVYKRAVAQAQWRKAERELGPTVAGQARYTLDDDVVDVVDVLYSDSEGSSPYSRTNKTAIWDIRTGKRSLVETGGVFAADFDTAGAKSVQFYPPPTVSGDSLLALVALEPEPLGDNVTPPAIPEDLHDALADGAISIGLRRVEEMIAEADSYETRYREGIGALGARANSQVGSRATRIPVYGYDF